MLSGKYTVELSIHSNTSLDVIKLSHALEQALQQIIPSLSLPVTLGEIKVLLPRATKVAKKAQNG